MITSAFTQPTELIGLFGLTTSELLGLSVFAAVVGALGNLLATWLKDFVSVRSFELWKERRELEAVYRRYRRQLLGAAKDLHSRTREICSGDRPPSWLRATVLAQKPKHLERNRSDDPYYQRYRLISTIYQLCALLGWLELYRQELIFLDPSREATNERLGKLFDNIRGDLADGGLNTARDRALWRDQLIFKEEQRAIGDQMLTVESPRRVRGYGEFLDWFESDGPELAEKRGWIEPVKGVFLDLGEQKDFRLSRLERLDGHLAETIELLMLRR